MEDKKYVLLIDDQEPVHRNVERTLSKFGYETKGSKHIPGGFGILLENSRHPSMIFLDYNLTEGDKGSDFIEELKSNEIYSSYRNIPLVGIGDFPENKRTALNEYLPKDLFNEESVKSLIDKLGI